MNFKITVIRKMSNPDYAEQYCRGGAAAKECPAFQVGREFIAVSETEKPEGFCGWAWDDISKYILIFRSGGNMGDSFNWMKDNNSVIACCTDGIRPVVFKIEKMDG